MAHADPAWAEGHYAKALQGTPWAERLVLGVRGAHLQVRFMEEWPGKRFSATKRRENKGNRWKTEEIWPFRAKFEGLGGWFGPPIDQISMDIEGFHLIIELISWLRACPKGTHLVVADDNIEQLIVEVPTQATENQGHGPKNAEKRMVWATKRHRFNSFWG